MRLSFFWGLYYTYFIVFFKSYILNIRKQNVYVKKESDFMQHYMNIIFSRNNTFIGKFVRFFSKFKYSHVSLALDCDFTKIYSFSRYYNWFCIPGGFTCKNIIDCINDTTGEIITIEITENDYKNILSFLHYLEKTKPKYSYLGIILLYCGKGYIDNDKYICCTFISKILSLTQNINLEKNLYLYTVKDLYELLTPLAITIKIFSNLEEVRSDKK